MRIAVIREGKTPSDSRVALTPPQCKYIMEHTPYEVVVQKSEVRAIQDNEYAHAGIPLVTDVSNADILVGVKEVPIEQLIDDKVYFFFSHTIKGQVYNRKLLQSMIKKGVHMVDYEVITNAEHQRLIAFGKFAGMVGAHNALYTYGKRTKSFSLKRMKELHDYQEAKEIYKKIHFSPCKIVLTGTGRVGEGAAIVLQDMGIEKIKPQDFLQSKIASRPTFTQLHIDQYYSRIDGKEFETDHFYKNPGKYRSIFHPYTKCADIMIHGIYWNPESPQFFTLQDMRSKDFKINVLADITCDIAPDSSIPSTIRPSTIEKPVYGFDPHSNQEKLAFQKEYIDVIAVDNLPNELPRDASEAFGKMFLDYVLPELKNINESPLIERATICKDHKLGRHFQYLQEFISEK